MHSEPISFMDRKLFWQGAKEQFRKQCFNGVFNLLVIDLRIEQEKEA